MPSVDFSLAETISLVLGRLWVCVRRVGAVRIVCLCDHLSASSGCRRQHLHRMSRQEECPDGSWVRGGAEAVTYLV